MSRSIDERIVDMQFNNQQFESGIKDSLGSLNKLKKGLDLDGASKSLSGLSNAGKNFSLAGIAEGVEKISSRFTTLGIIGITVLQNITNSAIEAGKQMIKSLSTDQITAGWGKYEQKTASVQTIMNSTGKSIDEVNGYLGRLMWFSDETSYSFTDMTAALSQMTTSGGDIDKLIPLITGVANATAYAGKGALEFQRSMYNLSQSYGSGALQYIDWRSLELAGVAGKDLKQVLIDTGVEMGKIAKGEVTLGNFAETLKDKWADTSVMEVAFGKFSQLSEETYKLVEAGQYDTAAEAMEALGGKFSEIAEKAFKSAQEAKSFSEAIAATKDAVSSGWMASFEHIFGNYEEATKLWTAVTSELWDIFASGAESRNEMLAAWKAGDGRWDLIEGAFNVLEGIREILRPIGEAFRDIFPSMTAERLLEITKNFRDLTRNFKIGEETADNLKRTFKGLFAFLDIGKQFFSAIGKGVGTLLKNLLPAGRGLLSFTGSIGDWLVALNETIKTGDVFNKALEKIVKGIEWVSEKVKIGITTIIDFFKSFGKVDLSGISSFSERIKIRFEPLTKLGEFISGPFSKMVEILKKVAPIFYKVTEIIGKAFGNLREKLGTALDNSDFNSFFDILNSGLFAGIMVGISKISNNLGNFTKSARWFLDGITESLEAMALKLKAAALLKIAIAIGVLAASLLLLSMINSEKLTMALAAITTLFVNLFGSLGIFEKSMAGTKFIGLNKMALAMIGISVAILILSAALKKLEGIDQEGVTNGLVGITALMAMLIGSMKVLSANTGALIKGTAGFVIFAAAIVILTSAVKKLAELDPASLAKGLIGVGVLMTELALFMKVTNLDGMGVGKGVGILLLAVAISILAIAVKKFGGLDTSVLIKGLIGITAVFTALAIFVNATGDAKKVISTAIGLTILGAAMLIFASAIEKMGNLSMEQIGKGLLTMGAALGIITLALQFMPKSTISIGIGLLAIAAALLILSTALSNMGGMSWEEIAKGLIVLAGSLTIIAAAMYFMTTALPGAAALLVISIALTILATVLSKLGNMSLSEIGHALLTLVGVFVILGVAALILGPVTPILLALAGAILLFSVATLAAGAGVLLFSTGLAALAVSGTAGAAALVIIVTSLLGLIPMAMEQIGKGIIIFASVIKEGIPAIAEAMKAVLLSIIAIIIEVTPEIIACIMFLLITLLVALKDAVPKMVDSGLKLIVGILKGIAENIDEVVAAGIDVILGFLKGVESKLPDVIDSAFTLIIAYINGLADAIRNNHDAIFDACENLVDAILDAFKSLASRFTKVGENVVTGLTDGIKNTIAKAKTAASNLANNIATTFKNILGIKSPSKTFQDYGLNIIEGLKAGIKDNTPKVVKETETMSKKVKEAGLKETVAWIEKRKYYNQLSLKEELATWEKLQKRYKQNSEERQKIDKEIYRVKNELMKEEYNQSIAWIDEKKFYNQLSLKDELAAWERVQSRYLEGTEERKRADREVYTLKNNLIKSEEEEGKKAFDHSVNWIDEKKYYNQLSLTEELAAWKRVQSRYLKGTEERKKADREVYRVKKELTEKQTQIDEEYYTKSQEINNKLKDNIKSLRDEYINAVESRADSLYSFAGLFDEFREQQKINGDSLIINLTNQVHAFEAWQRNINSLATKKLPDKLMEELRSMGPSSAAQIDALNRLSAPKLEAFVSLWQRKYYAANKQATSELEDMRIETNNQIAALTSETDKELEGLKSIWARQILSLTITTVEQFTELNTEIGKSVNILKKDTAEEFVSLGNSIKEVFVNNEWTEVGSTVITSIAAGIKNAVAHLVTVTKETVIMAVTAAKQALNQRINEEGFIDLSPTISPVLDLTDISEGLRAIFDKRYYLSVATTGIKAANISTSLEGPSNPGPPRAGIINNEDSSSLTIKNYYTVRGDSDIRKINQDLRNTLDRYNNAKGVLVP